MKDLNSKLILKNKDIPIIKSEIAKTINLSSSFGCICEKIILESGEVFVVKAQQLKNANQYPSIYFEGKSLKILNNKFCNFFPKIHHLEKNFFIMDWINHNNSINSSSEKDLAKKLAKIHSIKNGKVAGSNPWGALTLEWQTPSPTPAHNFLEEPKITHGPYAYDKVEAERTID